MTLDFAPTLKHTEIFHIALKERISSSIDSSAVVMNIIFFFDTFQTIVSQDCIETS